MNNHILDSIDTASNVIGKTWPLYSFVASNPLSGYENKSFHDAIQVAERRFNANSLPNAGAFRLAWERGEIDGRLLETLLKNNGFSYSPEQFLRQLDAQKRVETVNPNHDVDRIMAKWLAAFMDEGLADWDMPFKEMGFYKAWRELVIYDAESGIKDRTHLPHTSEEALKNILENYSEEEYVNIFTFHLAALPGWTGYINHRLASTSDWQLDYPITLVDYLAVRLWTAQKLNAAILPERTPENTTDTLSAQHYIWLQAWEETWQKKIAKTLVMESKEWKYSTRSTVADAQLVFCIDTRSELIRRHVESAGKYETYGYAGFFGIAMDYEDKNNGILRKSCPPIVSSAYTVTEVSQPGKEKKLLAYEKNGRLLKFVDYFLKRMKSMLPSAFGYVEGSGFFHGIALLARTLLPGAFYRVKEKNQSPHESICQPNINKANTENIVPQGIPLTEKVGIVKSAFSLMGWEKFSPLVVFVGHGSHSANNPFSSSLDCGACAASPGRHNARMLASLANLADVRKALAEEHGIVIPENTVFIGAEHNTTTDAIVLFDAQAPEFAKHQIQDLTSKLASAQQTATQERLALTNRSISSAQYKANDWSETRPEWGLAKNAGFIVGPRTMTKNINLEGRCFLHSYNWEQDTNGTALEGIMQGPMVVTQWINNHYYFSTIDNNTYGGGSKITHNITGKFGVVQGNGGDIKMGLPLQSLFTSDTEMYHQPLRLSVIIQAPIDRVAEILTRNKNVKELLDNEWIYLLVMDPMQHNETFRYKKSMTWTSLSEKKIQTQKVVEPDAILELV